MTNVKTTKIMLLQNVYVCTHAQEIAHICIYIKISFIKSREGNNITGLIARMFIINFNCIFCR